ncbi:hypothetical protein BGZ60DRAFT_420011 [Tricladium varicosporioides]|nr:hypothetical protein BGZ60DRAFT_420011 [Hymenoscyphus varicosporioides]
MAASTSLSKPPKIYLAGPDVFLANAVARGEELKAICTTHSAVGLFPLDNILDGHEPNSYKLADAIRTANMELIRQSDAVLANMTPFRGPSMDVGTAYEMGVGAALGKIVIGYVLESETVARVGGRVGKAYLEKVKSMGGKIERAEDGHMRDEEGWGVEEFYHEGEEKIGLLDNLMVACGVDAPICGSEEEGVKTVVEVLRKRAEAEDAEARAKRDIEAFVDGLMKEPTVP